MAPDRPARVGRMLACIDRYFEAVVANRVTIRRSKGSLP